MEGDEDAPAKRTQSGRVVEGEGLYLVEMITGVGIFWDRKRHES